MNELITLITDFIFDNSSFLIIISIVTVVTIIATMVLIPLVIINLSPDYFRDSGSSMYRYRHPVSRYTVLILKNILGYILLIAGFVMLFIPGQGLLSITLGFLCINFPGKKRIERRLFSNPKVNRIINLIRRKFGREEIFFSTV